MTPWDYHHPKTGEPTLVRVLAALSDPTRLEMIRRLTNEQEYDSLEFVDDLPRSTSTYHTHMLREAGVTWTRDGGCAHLIRLWRDDLDRLFPGVLAAMAANTGPGVTQA